MRILHLDDDPLQRDVVQAWLRPAGHEVVAVATGAEALRALERGGFDLAILDWRVPDVSGEEVLRWIRRRQPRMPVIFATANDTEEQVAYILGAGADDYLVKPLRRVEFLARIAALARRARGGADGGGVVTLGPYQVDFERRSIALGGQALRMTPRMTDVALLFFRKRGELVPRAQILEEVWGGRAQVETRTVDTHVSRVRHALELDGRHGWRLAAIYQHGYRLEEVPGGGAAG